MSNEVLEIGSSLFKGETPSAWKTQWEGPLQAQLYIEAVISKMTGLIRLREQALSDKFLGNVVQLSCVFNANTFLNALRQYTARKLKKPMDSLKVTINWDRSSVDASTSVLIENLWIQGCKCDGNRLVEAESSDPIFSIFPKFWLSWTPQEQIRYQNTIPLYINPSRETMVSNLLIPIEGIQTPWILAGVALFIESDI